MFVKICGLRTAGDVSCAVESGADAVGFVFTESPRQIGVDDARRLASAVPPEVLTVGVFLGMPVDQVRTVAVDSGIRAVQLHGDYATEDFAALADLPVRLVRATSLRAGTDVRTGASGEDLLILDSPKAGSGKAWDWAALQDARPTGQWLLAGGLHPGNVTEAITVAAPWGLDVSSGVESSRGVKSADLIREFLVTAKRGPQSM